MGDGCTTHRETRLPDFLAWSSPGAPHRGGGLPIEKPGLNFDARDQSEM